MQGQQCKQASIDLGNLPDHCGDELAFLAADGVIPIPAGLAKKALVIMPVAAKDLKFLDEVEKITKKAGPKIEFITKTGEKKLGEIIDIAKIILNIGPNVGIPLSKLGPEGVKVTDELVQLGGNESADKLFSVLGKKDDFFTVTDDYMAKTYKDIAKLKQKGLQGSEYQKLQVSLMSKVNVSEKNFNFENLKGTLGEIEFGANGDFVGNLSAYDYKIPGSTSNTPTVDYLLDTGDFIEVKKINMELVSPNTYNGTINDIVKKVKVWDEYVPNNKIYIGFTENFSPEMQGIVKQAIEVGLKEGDSTFNVEKLIFKWG